MGLFLYPLKYSKLVYFIRSCFFKVKTNIQNTKIVNKQHAHLRSLFTEITCVYFCNCQHCFLPPTLHLKKKIYLFNYFFWLRQVLVAACGIFTEACGILHCGMGSLLRCVGFSLVVVCGFFLFSSCGARVPGHMDSVVAVCGLSRWGARAQ